MLVNKGKLIAKVAIYSCLPFLLTMLSFCVQPQLGKPEIREVTSCWGNITHSESEILTEIVVNNPNPISLPIKDILNEVYMNELKMGEGKALKAEMPPGISSLIISTKIINGKIPEWWTTHLKNNETTKVNFKGFVIFDLKITEFRYPFEQTSLIKTNILSNLSSNEPRDIRVGPITLTVVSTSSYWGKIEKDYTEIITIAKIYNDGYFPVPVTKFRYTVEMNRIKLADGMSNVATVIPPKSEATLTLITKIDNKLLDEWFVSHLKNGERTEFRAVIEPFVEVFGKEISFVLIEDKSSFETRILGCWK